MVDNDAEVFRERNLRPQSAKLVFYRTSQDWRADAVAIYRKSRKRVLIMRSFNVLMRVNLTELHHGPESERKLSQNSGNTSPGEYWSFIAKTYN